MKKVLVSLLSIALIGCSQPILSNTSQYSDLDREYSQFTTEALTQSYLKKKMDKWLSDAKYSKSLVREIEYAKFKHKDLLKDIVALQPTMFDDITANTGVNQKRVESPFENYIQYINPYPSAVTANSATNITTSSFTASWTSNTKASSYKLFVNGSEVYSGANTSFDVTNLSFGTTPTYYVKAVNSAGTSPNSNTISVTLNPNVVTPTSPTNITTTGFTAQWTAVSGATSYKLKVDSNTPVDVGNITSSNVTGLTAGTTHTYSVQAVNSGGTGSSSADTTVTLLPSAPVATDGTSITTSSFTANWGSVTGATSYKLFVNGTEVYSGASTSCNVTSLASGTYTYYVKAINSTGESANSNTISVTLTANIVTALDATNVTQTSFTANWGAVTGATSYKLKVDSNAPIDVGAVTSSNVTGLTIGTTHTYSVQAVNAGGTGSSSNTISVTLNPAAPAVPTTLPATSVAETSFTANWNTVANATSYKLKIDTGAFVDVGNVTSYSVTGLASGTTHNYYVEASNISGTSASSTPARSVTLVPAAPVATLATNIAQTTFTANWNAVTGATSYKIYIDGSPTTLGNVLTYNKTSLTAGTAHTYYVQAINAGGTSVSSNTITLTTFLLYEFQRISVNYATESAYFESGTDKYLAMSTGGYGVKIIKWNGTNFSDYQTIPAENDCSLNYFEMGTDKFLITGNYGLASPWIANSKIYKWNTSTKQFETFQSIATAGASDGQYFTIGTDSYVVFANTNYYDNWNTNSVVYKWNGTSFAFYQNIYTYGAVAIKEFKAGGNDFLAFTFLSADNAASWYTNSEVYKWNTSTKQFDTFQAIPTYMGSGVDSFQIGTDTYLTFANRYYGSYSTTSSMYKWNGTNFALVQNLPTLGAFGFDFFEIGGDKYLGIANYRDDSTYSVNSYIYKWNTSTSQFTTTTPFLSLASVAVRAIKHFAINGHDYIFISSSGDVESKIYRLN